MKDRILEIYKKRQEAHDILLKCDIEVDEILKDIIQKIDELIAEEIIIANKAAQPTSRLTSLAMKINFLFEKDDNAV